MPSSTLKTLRLAAIAVLTLAASACASDQTPRRQAAGRRPAIAAAATNRIRLGRSVRQSSQDEPSLPLDCGNSSSLVETDKYLARLNIFGQGILSRTVFDGPAIASQY